MAVLLKNGAVFLHIPKTGGSWVTEVLQSNGLVRRQFSHIHADLSRAQMYSAGPRIFMRAMLERLKSRVPNKVKAALWSLPARRAQAARVVATGPPTASGPFYFCFVRHPLTWYESWWQYMCNRSGGDWSRETDLLRWHPCAALRALGDEDFNQFMRNVVNKQAGFVTELYGRYAPHGTGFIGRQENLADDLITVLGSFNVKFDEGRIRDHRRVNVTKNSSIAWDPGLRAEVERLEYAGLVRYGYVERQGVESPFRLQRQ